MFFHLAENKKNSERPFAFLATYTSRVGESSRVRHVALGKAVEEFAGAEDSQGMIGLLQPIHRAAGESEFLRGMFASGEIYQPALWSVAEAFLFLQEMPRFEKAGIVVRLPDWWRGRAPAKPVVKVEIGSPKGVGIGVDELLGFSADLALDGEKLTPEEERLLMAATDHLILLRGKWIEVDPQKLKEVLGFWRQAARAAHDGLSFHASMRLLAGANLRDAGGMAPPEDVADWSEVVAGRDLAALLSGLRDPEGGSAALAQDRARREIILAKELKATLRPYQQVGVGWLWLLYQLKLGGCLADDMGLGKTIQVIALLLLIKKETKGRARHLLVVPASLIGNWTSEIERFAPTLRYFVAHRSQSSTAQWQKVAGEGFAGCDVVIATYGGVLKLAELAQITWSVIVLDEAQAIKNPETQQTRKIKTLKSQQRLILTGTPIENRLTDLWSLFDFTSPGLLGSAKVFGGFVKGLAVGGHDGFAPLRRLVKPYILRRMKTDKSVIADLPDKTEMTSYCSLRKTQIILYKKVVDDLKLGLDGEVEGMRRRGLILASLIKLKQLCNHPSHLLGDGLYDPAHSGKFARLAELCETIASKHEKVIVFTQFKEITQVLADYLGGIFGGEGLTLHGGTPVGQRRKLVERFQGDPAIAYFVLSLKAGGTGLNLTAASHVIHFDRWWNPAVENQATDRAFRIGQKRNVLVHKFLCRGTLEERIDAMISAKKGLASEILGGGEETMLTEMSNDELLQVVSLDLQGMMDD